MDANKLKVFCSPGTFDRVKEDAKYRKEVTQHVLSGEDMHYSEVVYSVTNAQNVEELAKEAEDKIPTPTETVETMGSADYAETVFTPLGDEAKQYWSEAAIKLMLASIEELQPKVGKSIAVKSRAKMYSIVSERMDAAKCPFTPLQIEYKFRAMERQYKKMVLNNRQTGRSRQTCPFEKELDQILGKKKGINPEFALESTDVYSVPLEEDLSSDLDQAVLDNTPSCSRQAPKRRKLSPADDIFTEMVKIRKSKEEFHSKVLEIMRKKDERAEKKLPPGHSRPPAEVNLLFIIYYCTFTYIFTINCCSINFCHPRNFRRATAVRLLK